MELRGAGPDWPSAQPGLDLARFINSHPHDDRRGVGRLELARISTSVPAIQCLGVPLNKRRCVEVLTPSLGTLPLDAAGAPGFDNGRAFAGTEYTKAVDMKNTRVGKHATVGRLDFDAS